MPFTVSYPSTSRVTKTTAMSGPARNTRSAIRQRTAWDRFPQEIRDHILDEVLYEVIRDDDPIANHSATIHRLLSIFGTELQNRLRSIRAKMASHEQELYNEYRRLIVRMVVIISGRSAWMQSGGRSVEFFVQSQPIWCGHDATIIEKVMYHCAGRCAAGSCEAIKAHVARSPDLVHAAPSRKGRAC